MRKVTRRQGDGMRWPSILTFLILCVCVCVVWGCNKCFQFQLKKKKKKKKKITNSIFSLLRKPHAISHTTGSECMRKDGFPFSMPCQPLLSFIILRIVRRMGLRLFLVVLLICISLMIRKVEHIFHVSVAICV
jgi:hypothetical protein